MSTTMSNLAAWLRPVEEYLELWRSARPDEVPAGASPQELQQLKTVGEGHGLHVPDQYLDFLKLVNGTGYDGFNFSGWNVRSDRLSNFIESNSPEFDAFNGDVTIYGNSDGVIYTYSKSSERYSERDGPDPTVEFDTFGQMIEYAFSRKVDLMRKLSVND